MMPLLMRESRHGHPARAYVAPTQAELQSERLRRYLALGQGDAVRALRALEAALREAETSADEARARGWHGAARGWDETASMVRGDALALVALEAEAA